MRHEVMISDTFYISDNFVLDMNLILLCNLLVFWSYTIFESLGVMAARPTCILLCVFTLYGVTLTLGLNSGDQEFNILKDIMVNMDEKLKYLIEDKQISDRKIAALEERLVLLEETNKALLNSAPTHEKLRKADSISNRRARAQNLGPDTVAFTAVMAQSNETLRIRQTVIFPTVLHNSGNAYDSRLGVFHAPTNGTYFFSVSVMSYPGDWIETELVKNGNTQLLIFSGGSTLRSNQGSSSATLHLEAGDIVWVRIIAGGGYKIFGSAWTSFTGFRL